MILLEIIVSPAPQVSIKCDGLSLELGDSIKIIYFLYHIK